MGLFSSLRVDKHDAVGYDKSEHSVDSSPGNFVSRANSEYHPKQQERFDMKADATSRFVSVGV